MASRLKSIALAVAQSIAASFITASKPSETASAFRSATFKTSAASVSPTFPQPHEFSAARIHAGASFTQTSVGDSILLSHAPSILKTPRCQPDSPATPMASLHAVCAHLSNCAFGSPFKTVLAPTHTPRRISGSSNTLDGSPLEPKLGRPVSQSRCCLNVASYFDRSDGTAHANPNTATPRELRSPPLAFDAFCAAAETAVASNRAGHNQDANAAASGLSVAALRATRSNTSFASAISITVSVFIKTTVVGSADRESNQR